MDGSNLEPESYFLNTLTPIEKIMNRVEAEWILAYALVNKKVASIHDVCRTLPINVPPKMYVKTCKKCGKLYVRDCIPCSFRNGGDFSESERHEDDLCEQMNDLMADAGFKLENALQWMRIQQP